MVSIKKKLGIEEKSQNEPLDNSEKIDEQVKNSDIEMNIINDEQSSQSEAEEENNKPYEVSNSSARNRDRQAENNEVSEIILESNTQSKKKRTEKSKKMKKEDEKVPGEDEEEKVSKEVRRKDKGKEKTNKVKIDDEEPQRERKKETNDENRKKIKQIKDEDVSGSEVIERGDNEEEEEESKAELKSEDNQKITATKHFAWDHLYKGVDARLILDVITSAGIYIPIIPAFIASFYSHTAQSVLNGVSLMSAVLNFVPNQFHIWNRVKKIENVNSHLAQEITVEREMTWRTKPILHHMQFALALVSDLAALSGFALQIILDNISHNPDDFTDDYEIANLATFSLASLILITTNNFVSSLMHMNSNYLEDENNNLTELKSSQNEIWQALKLMEESLTELNQMGGSRKQNKALAKLNNQVIELLQEIEKLKESKANYSEWIKKLEDIQSKLEKLEQKRNEIAQGDMFQVRAAVYNQKKKLEGENKSLKKDKIKLEEEKNENINKIAQLEALNHSKDSTIKDFVAREFGDFFAIRSVSEINTDESSLVLQMQLRHDVDGDLSTKVKRLLEHIYPDVEVIVQQQEDKEQEYESEIYLEISSESIEQVHEFLHSIAPLSLVVTNNPLHDFSNQSLDFDRKASQSGTHSQLNHSAFFSPGNSAAAETNTSQVKDAKSAGNIHALKLSKDRVK